MVCQSTQELVLDSPNAALFVLGAAEQNGFST